MPNALVFLVDGFEEIEAITIIDVLRRAEVDVLTVSVTSSHEVKGAHGLKVLTDKLTSEMYVPWDENSKTFDMVILPGGQPGTDNLRKDSIVQGWINQQAKNKKYIAAICAAPLALIPSGILSGRTITSYPGVRSLLEEAEPTLKYEERNVVVDKNLITSRGPATAIEFSLTLAELLVGKEKTCSVAKDVLADSSSKSFGEVA